MLEKPYDFCYEQALEKRTLKNVIVVLILQGFSFAYNNNHCKQMAVAISITTSPCEGELHFVGRGREGRLLKFPYSYDTWIYSHGAFSCYSESTEI